MLEPALLIRSCTEWLISPIWVLFLGQIVVSHVQSIAKLSLNVSKSQISTFFTPIQSYFLFGRKCPPLSLSLSRVYRKEKTHRSYAANRWLVMNDLFLNLFFTPTLFSPIRSCRPIWLESNGGVLCGKVPPLRPSFSQWQRRTRSCVVSAAASLQMSWVCGEGTTPRVGESSGSSGGGTTRVLRSLSTMSSQVSWSCVFVKLYR